MAYIRGTPPPPSEFQKLVTATFSHNPICFHNFVFNSLRTYNRPKGDQSENCFGKSCILGKRTKKNNGKCGSRGGGGEMDWQRVNGYFDWLSYGFLTSKTQTAHLLSISGVNFILFALKTSHCGIQLHRLSRVLKITATVVLFYQHIRTL